MPRRHKSSSLLESDPQWYRDAVIYELHIKAFQDSNDDGIGDIRGVISRLDYLQHLGVTALWFLPFYRSPQRDGGYDIAKYTEIDPIYGTLADFRELLDEAHNRGLRVITELVLNHTSDQHPWFQKSRAAKPGSKWRGFYVWSDTPERYADARIIFKDFESSNWSWDPVAKAYYWHRFYSHQPDINFDSPHVHKAMLDVIDFWFDMGVDGVRLDAVPYLYEREDTNCENLPETHAFLKKLRAHVDRKYQDRMLLAEANQWPEDAVAYFGEGDECHMAFNFPVMPRMFMAVQMEDRYPLIEMFDPPLSIPETCQWALFLRNHDELTLEMVTEEERDYMYRMYADDPRAKINLGIRRRLAPLLGNNRRRIELMNTLLFSLPGTPVLYYGDEIGMGDNYYLGDRDGVRTPMQWSADRNAGFSRANPQRLYLPVIIDPEYHYEAVNVESQDRNLSTLLWWVRRMIAMRKKYRAFGRGSLEFLAPSNSRVLAFLRRYEDEVILVVVNLSRFPQCAELDLSEFVGYVPSELFSGNTFAHVRPGIPYQVTLGPHDYYWFSLQPVENVTSVPVHPLLPSVKVDRIPTNELPSGFRERLEQRLLLPYLQRSRWFGGKNRRVGSITIVEDFALFRDGQSFNFLLATVEYVEGLPDTYQLPIGFAVGERAAQVRESSPNAVIAEMQVGEESGVIFDAVVSDEFRQLLFDMVARRRKIVGRHGEISSSRSPQFRREVSANPPVLPSRLLGGEQSNTSILYNDSFLLKLYRKVEDGANPDVEMGRLLTERIRFPHVPAFKGSLAFERPKREPQELALMQAFVPNQGDAWGHFLGHIERYLDYALSRRDEQPQLPENCAIRVDPDGWQYCDALRPVMGDFQTEIIRLLGRRTAELHLALASVPNYPDFAPEGFSLLYQRSVFQSMRNLVKSVLRSLQEALPKLPDGSRAEAERILAHQNAILANMRRITEKRLSALKMRIHGDYHLGQLLFTGKDFVILDFEGEPARPLWERRLKRSPLRDVAGMIRSFDYAINTGLRRHPSIRPEDLPALRPWAKAWYYYTATHFVAEYLAVAGQAPFLPRKAEEATLLLEVFLLAKAVYELGYELNNRPDWADIPLEGIGHILGLADGW